MIYLADAAQDVAEALEEAMKDRILPHAIRDIVMENAVLQDFCGGCSNFINIYMICVLVRLYAAYFPNINSFSIYLTPFASIVDPVVGLFSRFLPETPMVDFTVVVLFWVLQSIQAGLNRYEEYAIIPLGWLDAPANWVVEHGIKFFLLADRTLDFLYDKITTLI